MTNRYDELQKRRRAFNLFAATVRPAGTHEKDLGFADLARCINEETARRQYSRLAIELLDANIAFYGAYASGKRMARPSLIPVVASTLVVAGLVHHFEGTTAALVVAGAWYWFFAKTIANPEKAQNDEARNHNADAAGWAEAIRDWEAEREALRNILGVA